MLSLANNATLATPPLQRRVSKIFEATRSLAHPFVLGLGSCQFIRNLGRQPEILRQPQNVINFVAFAPSHNILTGKAGITPQNDLHVGPTFANRRDKMFHDLHHSGTAVDVRRPQFRRQKMLSAKSVEWKVAVVLKVAVEESAFLLAVQNIVRGVQVDYDLLWRGLVRLEKNIHEQ